MASKDDGFTEFEPLLQEADCGRTPWGDTRYVPDIDLLRRLLTLPIRDRSAQTTGRTAKALDAWIAHELRRAGFSPNAVWPRSRKPRVLPEGLDVLEECLGDLGKQLDIFEKGQGGRLKPPELRNAIKRAVGALPGSANAFILGDFYAKQVDVGLSSWDRGPDILISTKTMLSAYGKNLKTRHEEAVGEVASLRRRHPRAAMGFAFLVRHDIDQFVGALALVESILTRLRRPGEMFDATMLLVGHWDDNQKPVELVEISEPLADLNAGNFFATMISTVLERTPIGEHREARLRRDGPPRGGLPGKEDTDVESDPE